MRTWKTAEGDEIPLEKMTDRHVQNAYAYVGRRLASNPYKDDVIHDVSEVETIPYAPDTDADGTADFVNSLHDLLIQADSDRTWRARFREEAQRRGLVLPD